MVLNRLPALLFDNRVDNLISFLVAKIWAVEFLRLNLPVGEATSAEKRFR